MGIPVFKLFLISVFSIGKQKSKKIADGLLSAIVLF